MSKSTAQSYFLAGVFISLAGSVCFSTKAIFVKLAYASTTVDAVTLLALRMIFSIPFFITSAAISSSKSSNVKFTANQWISVAVIGCLGYYVSSLLDFIGLQYVTAGIERLILFIYPTLVVIISSLVFKAKITKQQWIAIIVTYVGLVFAFWGEAKFDSTDANFVFGSVLIFICAITYAIYIVGSGRLIPSVGAAKFNSYAMSFACIAVMLHFFVTKGAATLFNLETDVYIFSVSMAIIGTVIPSYLVTEGIKRVGSDNAAIIGSIGPVSTIIQANIFLDEPILLLQIIGTGFILFGVLLIGKKRKPVPAPGNELKT